MGSIFIHLFKCLLVGSYVVVSIKGRGLSYVSYALSMFNDSEKERPSVKDRNVDDEK